jgi:hypothetical protein
VFEKIMNLRKARAYTNPKLILIIRKERERERERERRGRGKEREGARGKHE